MDDVREMQLQVEGMTCGSCVRHVTEALRGVDGVAAVQVDRDHDRVLVRHDPARATPEALVAALDRAGYPARPQG
jgi:copper chaperone CopZ